MKILPNERNYSKLCHFENLLDGVSPRSVSHEVGVGGTD